MAGAELAASALLVALQVLVGVRLATRVEAWARWCSALFLLNAIIALDTFGIPRIGEIAVVLDGVTGLLVGAFALAYARGRVPSPLLWAGAAWTLTWSALSWMGVLDPDVHRVLQQSLPVVGGYAAFVVAVVFPWARGRDPRPSTPWLIAAFLPRAVEFPVRYLPQVADGVSRTYWPFWLALAVLAVACVVAVALAIRARIWRVRTAQDLALVAGLGLVGLAFGVTEITSGGVPEAVRQLSLLVLRPICVSIAIWGFPATVRGLSGVLALGMLAVLGAVVAPEMLREPGWAGWVGAAAILAAALIGLGPSVVRRPTPRWERAIVFLAGPGRAGATRAEIGRHLGILPRNVERVILEANRAGRSPYVLSDRVRGASNRVRIVYSLTPEGEIAAREIEREKQGLEPSFLRSPASSRETGDEH